MGIASVNGTASRREEKRVALTETTMGESGVSGDPEEKIRPESDAKSETLLVSELVGAAFTRWDVMEEDQLLESVIEGDDSDTTAINLPGT